MELLWLLSHVSRVIIPAVGDHVGEVKVSRILREVVVIPDKNDQAFRQTSLIAAEHVGDLPALIDVGFQHGFHVFEQEGYSGDRPALVVSGLKDFINVRADLVLIPGRLLYLPADPILPLLVGTPALKLV